MKATITFETEGPLGDAECKALFTLLKRGELHTATITPPILHAADIRAETVKTDARRPTAAEAERARIAGRIERAAEKGIGD